MPGLDIIDYEQYFDGIVDISISLTIEDNSVSELKASSFSNITNWICRKDQNDCHHLKEHIQNTFANRVIGDISALKDKDSFNSFD